MNEAMQDNLEELVTLCAQHDEEAARKLYDRIVELVYNYISLRTHVKEQAIDLTQDVCIDLFAALRGSFQYQSEATFYAFLFTIVRRKLAKHYHREKQRFEQQVNEFEEHTVPDEHGNDITQADAIDVRNALRELEETASEIIILRHWSRCTFAEIAALLDMNESAVRTRHHRAMKMLQSKLGQT
ncbi:MAG: sigma-70 family RNA polymerase sigma factor [Candidatus Kaiserbacteria bacterium]|nr:sigma-70 family RNA polymerase sigma factor [Candidatus Kaiserbacteria bacterium]MCB9816740.1 sigma-70 family RNA polymerase sigma factor [Candidatus Nomurabacteria bacterium]